MPGNSNHDFDAKQRPDERSKEHGKRDQAHGPHEHGTGARRDPDASAGGEFPFLAAADFDLAGATLPAYFYVPNKPPVTDQGSSPRCVAYSNAYDQNQHDRPEIGAFRNFDEAKFFTQIGGTSQGAYMTAGLKQRRDFGYPEQDSTPARGQHRIRSFAQIPLTASAVKAALYNRRHGVLFIGPWYHSWFHPLASGKLPAPDYEIGGHAIWARGYNDAYGVRLRNSWGTDWGLAGDAFLPYAHLDRMWSAYTTVDA